MLHADVLKRSKLPVHTWTFWFSIDRSGETQVALCILLCWNTTLLLKAHRLASLSPLSFPIFQPVLSYDLLKAFVVVTNIGTAFSHHGSNFWYWAVLNDGKQSGVKFFFDILVVVICWGITLNNIHVDPPFHGSEGGLKNSWSCLPPSRCCPYCFTQHQYHSLGVWCLVFLTT